MTRAVLRLPAVTARTGLSRATIYKRIKDGTFPRPIPLGSRIVGWLDDEIDAWIEDCVGEADVQRELRDRRATGHR